MRMRKKTQEGTAEQEYLTQAQIQELQELEEMEPELTQEQKDLIELADFLRKSDSNSPGVAVLEAWKARHKSLYVSRVSSESNQNYVFTTIKRQVFKTLQGQGVFEDEEKGNEVLVEKCLLYPEPTVAWRMSSDAGVITTLGKQIAYKSGFVSQQEALSLIKIV